MEITCGKCGAKHTVDKLPARKPTLDAAGWMISNNQAPHYCFQCLYEESVEFELKHRALYPAGAFGADDRNARRWEKLRYAKGQAELLWAKHLTRMRRLRYNFPEEVT